MTGPGPLGTARYHSRHVIQVVHDLVARVAFWTGIIIPLSYPLFIIRGVRTKYELILLVTLVAVNYVALFFGYSYYAKVGS